MITIDPYLFTEEAIAPETQAMNDQIEAFLKAAPSIIDLGAPKVRELRRAGQGVLANQPEHKIASWGTAIANGLDVPVRIFKPAGDLEGVYLHIHGGGHAIGSADAQDQTLATLAETLSFGVVSVEYRLAPENIWPAPADDCEAAALWLVENANALFGTDKVTIGGESAGGHLAAVTIVRLKHRHGMSPFSGANLVYGAYDFSGTPTLKSWGDRNLIISQTIVDYFAEQLLPAATFPDLDRKDPDMSPLYADLSGLCPALFSVGTLDPILDDTLFMAPRWLASGNKTELAIYSGGIHAFDMIPGLPLAEEFHQRVYKFLGEVVA
ncbi:MAG: alpha/beta hydrolase [Pseudomonadota bacterium]